MDYGESSDVILSFNDFSVSFKVLEGKVNALDHINLKLERGTILGIIGESGSGKTTIAMSALHLLPDNAEISGGVNYYDRQIYDESVEGKGKISRKARKELDSRLIDIRWKEIAMVFQGAMNAFNPVRTIRNQIEEVFKVHGTFDDLSQFSEEDYVDREVLRAKAAEEYKRLRAESKDGESPISEDEIYRNMVDNNLEIYRNGSQKLKRRLLMSNRIEKVARIAGFNTSFLDSYPHELSGGMKQRGILTMALALFPRILVADEPTTGLDAISQAKIIKEMRNLKENKTVDAMIVISHDVGVVAQLADKVAVMYAGRVMEYGSPKEIFNYPSNPYTYSLINSYPALSKAKKWVEGIPGHVPSLIDPPKGCYFANRCFMAEDVCHSFTPSLKDLGNGHLSLCHFSKIDYSRTPEASKVDLISDTQNNQNSETMVEAVNLSKYFPLNTGFLTSLFGGSKKHTVHAVDQINLTIKEGDIIGLVGESGSGKSTLGRVMVNAIDPTSGEVKFRLGSGDSESAKYGFTDITKIKKKSFIYFLFRRKAQLIFQDPYDSLNPKRTIYDSLAQAVRLGRKNMKEHGEGSSQTDSTGLEERVKMALETCDLLPADNYLDRYPHELSGGERQRICTARAISLNPSFLVADEPISMLDVSIRANILNLLRKLRAERKMSILYISHDIASARYISDYIAVMYLGQIVEYGRSEDIIKDPMHPYTKSLILSVPDIDPNWITRDLKIFGEIGNAINPESRCRFYDRCVYRKDICKQSDPPLLHVNNRYYKCHFSQDELIEERELLNEV